MGVFDNLFKTKAQREEETARYYEWAYPYGPKHKEMINDIIHAVVPDEDDKIAIYNYLVCRQEMAPSYYEGPFIFDRSNSKSVRKKLKKEYNSKGKKDIHKYIALVEADLKVDENLEFPSVDEILKYAEEIKQIL